MKIREKPTKITESGEVMLVGYVKELTVPKTPMKEDMWMPFTKTKTRKTSYAPLTKK